MIGAWEKIVPALERLSGDTGVYLCNLVTGDMRAYAADKPSWRRASSKFR